MEQHRAAPPPTPEVDPELAAMEHQHHTHLQAKTSKENDEARGLLGLLNRITQRRGRGMGTPSTGKVVATKVSEARWKRRQMERYGTDPDPRRQPHARLGRMRGRATQASREADFRMQAKQFLRKMKIIQLVRECPEMKLVVGFGNVYALSQCSTEVIRAIPGLGPVKRKKIYEYLRSKNVPLKWQP